MHSFHVPLIDLVLESGLTLAASLALPLDKIMKVGGEPGLEARSYASC